MKKILLTLVLVLTSVGGRADIFWDNYLFYTVTSAKEHTVAVTGIVPGANLSNIIIPESVFSIAYDETYSVTSINDGAFERCNTLSSITIPNSVTSIGNRAFSGCSALTSINIPNNVTSIGYAAFDDCSALTSINIPYGVTKINMRTFCNCSSLTSITIPNSVTEIGNAAFYYCSGLTSIAIPNTIVSIEAGAFGNCTGLTSIVIPGNVTEISGAFYSCYNLEHIAVADNNTVYDSRDNCNAIIETSSNTLVLGCKNTDIPNSVTAIGNGAFNGCEGLVSVSIPNSVTEIGEDAFYNCIGLTSVSIGDGVKTIGSWTFENCIALEDFYCFAENIPTTGSDTFSGVNLRSATLHVPAASLEAYSAKSPWKIFGQIVPIGEGDGIERVNSKEENPTVSYDLSGRRTAKIQKGINILRGANGHVKKVLRK